MKAPRLVPVWRTRRPARPAHSRHALHCAIDSLEVRRLFAAITVTGTGDTIATDGVVTLREAITAANTNAPAGDAPAGTPGLDTINFSIAGAGVKTINVANVALPTITDPVSINGYTQGAAAANTLANGDNAVILVELNGGGAGAAANGLVLGAGSGGSTVRGLAVNNFGDFTITPDGKTREGILVQSDGNTIAGNFVGVDPTGTTARPNGSDGIHVESASNNTIGGLTPADRNVASGNSLDGIHIVGFLNAPATDNLVQGNFVGPAADGKSSVGNRTLPAPAPGTAQGNNLFGIEVSGGNNNTVGGTAAGARNVVGLNGAGIEVDDGGQANVIQGNFSGVGADGVTPIGNLLHGVVLRSSGVPGTFGAPVTNILGPGQPNEPGVSFNTVGGTAAGAGNLVEFNGTGGIAVFGNPVSASGQPNIGNAILGNSVFLNGRSSPTTLLGIDLTNGFLFAKDDGLTPNDSKGHGAPEDPNNFQNFPVLTSVTTGGGTTTVKGTLGGAANSTFRVELFANDADPAGGIAEGQQFLGFVNATTNAGGVANFTATLSGTLAAGRVVTATATDGIGNTSEFSAPKGVAGPLAVSINDVSTTEGSSGTKDLTFTVTLSAASAGTVLVHYVTADGTAKAGDNDYTAIAGGTVKFNPGQTSQTVTVKVKGDTKVEADETFFVNLSAPIGATIADAQGKGTILNDDAAAPKASISINNESAFEGNSGLRPITFNVTLDQASSQQVLVHYVTADGTAKASDNDYVAIPGGTVTFNPGQTQKTITVMVKGDTKKEADETFFVVLSAPINASLANSKGTGTIRNDD